uniref:Uncharacterized protein n=1 Tax=Chelonoidis abingdonii TaxID=106734 RepID=A0A8C0H0K4_CHEAB
KSFFTFFLFLNAVMAAGNPAKSIQDELTCSICLDYFKDPVSLDCDHNFCRACITQCWEGFTTEISCPQCREIFPQRNLRCPSHLRGPRCQNLDPKLKAISNVTLDPDTAHPQLILSENQKSVRYGDTRQRLPNNPERFDTACCVLGCAGFTSGRHCWEVEVGAGLFWAVGVARESVRRKGRISLSTEWGIWAVERLRGQVQALTSPVTPLSLSRVPSRIRVCLDCDQGQVTFINAGDEAPIFTFLPGSVSGGRIRPWLCMGRGRGTGNQPL